ncbi:hypothetical protein OG900_04030 [Streptomyces sp. NBC_00433]
MSVPGGVWIADVVRALSLASPGDTARQQAIARLLGMEVRGAAPDDAAAPAGPAALDLPGGGPAPGGQGAGARDDGSHTDAAVPVAVDATGTLPLLPPVGFEPPPEPVWSGAALPAQNPRSPDARPGHEPLLAPRSANAVLHRALSRDVPEGELDIPGVIRLLATGRPVAGLPHLPVRTLRYGVQLLADVGTGMEPFSRDVHEMIDRVRTIVGREGTEVLYFDDCPTRGTGPGLRWSWQRYAPPPRGTRVLVLTDLGLGGPPHSPRRGTRGEWEQWVGALLHAGCTPVAFVPLPPRRWPGWAVDLLPLMAWDRNTTAGWARTHLG